VAGIFLSYSRADRPIAQSIAEALEAEGFTVWWDKILRAGQTYDEVTENMLRESSVVVVLWSQTSVKSKWVRAEATLGERNAVVIPAMIEEAERPIMFELTQTADLVGWVGDRSLESWQDFVADISRVIDMKDGALDAPTTNGPTPSGSADIDATIENTYWTSIQDTNDPSELESYLKRYPQGHFSDLARSRLSAMAAPPRPVEAAAPAAQVAPQRATPSASAPQKTAAGSRLPMILAAVVALGAAGWGASLIMPSGEKRGDLPESTIVNEPAFSCEGCPQLINVPAGTFIMGSPDSESGRVGNEGPLVEVTLSGFQMSRTEITGGEWAVCVSAGGCPEVRTGGEGLPVGSVSWNDAQSYVRWLSNKTGHAFRLPTEAEWEYAARGGTSSVYWWGDGFTSDGVVNGHLVEVASLPENPFGLVGMLGNLREWVEDCYTNSYTGSTGDGRAVQSGNCGLRVVRGGSFKHGASEHRAANRARMAKGTKDPAVGFRVVVALPVDD